MKVHRHLHPITKWSNIMPKLLIHLNPSLEVMKIWSRVTEALKPTIQHTLLADENLLQWMQKQTLLTGGYRCTKSRSWSAVVLLQIYKVHSSACTNSHKFSQARGARADWAAGPHLLTDPLPPPALRCPKRLPSPCKVNTAVCVFITLC